MTSTIKSKATAEPNVVAGFSERFNLLLDRAELPKRNRVMEGSRRFNVVPNTFKSWCVANRIPRNHAALVNLVEQLLENVPGQQNPQAVVAWLLAGDAVPDPFEQTNALAMVELYFQIDDLAKRNGIDFGSLPREARNLVLRRVAGSVCEKTCSSEERLDDATASIALLMLETAVSLA